MTMKKEKNISTITLYVLFFIAVIIAVGTIGGTHANDACVYTSKVCYEYAERTWIDLDERTREVSCDKEYAFYVEYGTYNESGLNCWSDRRF